jgi:hypothetical protein
LFAEAGITVYWIANIPMQRIEVYSDPTGPDRAPHYRKHADYSVQDSVPLTFDTAEVARINVRDLLCPYPW